MNTHLIKRIFKISTVLFILLDLVFSALQQTVIFDFSTKTFVYLVSVISAMAVYCAFGIKYYKLIYGLPIFMVAATTFISGLPLVILTVLYLLPVVIALSTDNKPYIISLAFLTVVGYFVFKGTCDYKSISYEKYDRIPFVLGQGIPFLCEVIIVCYSAFPFVSAFDKSKKEIKKYNEDLKRSELETVMFCSAITSYHSAYLRIHTGNVEEYTKFILDNLEGTKYEWLNCKSRRADILFGARLHDIGKCYISDSLLDKNGPLTDKEFDIIKQHTIKGRELFDSLPSVSLSHKTRSVCRNIIYSHHERLDGKGYPEGLKENEIPVEAKLVAVADVTDALLSYRSYKLPFTKEQFVREMSAEKNSKLDETFVDIVIKNIDALTEIARTGNDELKKEERFRYDLIPETSPV